MDDVIEARINSFKQDLRMLSLSDHVTKLITVGDCYSLDDRQHFKLKNVVATHFHSLSTRVTPLDVVLVGSSKLGFSIAPSKRYRAFGSTSDIDIAIISSELFDNIWLQVFKYTQTQMVWRDEKRFKRYHFNGWMRPDLLPIIGSATGENIKRNWFEFFESLTASGDYGQYKISAGLYKSLEFLQVYQTQSIHGCMLQEGLL